MLSSAENEFRKKRGVVQWIMNCGVLYLGLEGGNGNR